MNNAFDLSNRVAVVTGAAGLLGSEHCHALAAAGAVVVCTDVDRLGTERIAAVLEEIFGANCAVPLAMDVASPESVAQARETIIGRLGRVDILVNNAAIDPKVKTGSTTLESSRLEHFPMEQWHLQLSVGLTGAFVCAREFGTWMAEHDGGVILNIASDLSVFAPDQRIYRNPQLPEAQQPVKPVTYSVIKTGLIGLTRYLATYWADRNIRVNALSPGGVFNDQPDEFVQRLTNLIPMGRMASRNEYHGAVQFLCSDAARYMTGQNVVMDGGRSVW